MKDGDNPYVREELRKAQQLFEDRRNSPIVRKAKRAYNLCLGIVILLTAISLCILIHTIGN